MFHTKFCSYLVLLIRDIGALHLTNEPSQLE